MELLNGCLAVAHSNLFIPSTLGGPCYTEKGLDKEQLAKNLELAMDVYIRKVDGAPCAKQPIRLVKGANGIRGKHLGERRPKLLTFLKGKKNEKEALKQSEPTLYSYFEEVWGVRNRHMVKDLPHPYVFMLLPCKAKDCRHPRCQDNGNSDNGSTWFPGGPPLSYFPIPIADPKRPWGGPCEQCGDKCPGHYLRPEEHHNFYQTHGRQGMIH